MKKPIGFFIAKGWVFMKKPIGFFIKFWLSFGFFLVEKRGGAFKSEKGLAVKS